MEEQWPLAVALGLSLSIIGFGLAWLAGELEPGPLIGVRLSYATVSKRVWARVNRVLGLVLGVSGLLMIPVGLFLGIAFEALLYAVVAVASVVFAVEYSKRLAEIEAVREPPPDDAVEASVVLIERLPRSWRVLIAVALALSTVVYVYAVAEIVRLGLWEAGLVLLVVLTPTLYTSYLSLARPEAYSLPWVGGDYKLFALLTPLLLILVDVSIGLLLLDYTLASLVALSMSAVIAILLVYRSLSNYRRYMRAKALEASG
ncbi:MAG: hypothetical protein F7C38_00240 [Desulfurococcales archaeon]|nr:hypothetical protein [Desulfurococcales archaeon]